MYGAIFMFALKSSSETDMQLITEFLKSRLSWFVDSKNDFALLVINKNNHACMQSLVAKPCIYNVILSKNGELERGVNALAKERSKWLERPDLLVRAARHYEGAAQILIRQAVMTAKEVSKVQSSEQDT